MTQIPSANCFAAILNLFFSPKDLGTAPPAPTDKKDNNVTDDRSSAFSEWLGTVKNGFKDAFANAFCFFSFQFGTDKIYKHDFKNSLISTGAPSTIKPREAATLASLTQRKKFVAALELLGKNLNKLNKCYNDEINHLIALLGNEANDDLNIVEWAKVSTVLEGLLLNKTAISKDHVAFSMLNDLYDYSNLKYTPLAIQKINEKITQKESSQFKLGFGRSTKHQFSVAGSASIGQEVVLTKHMQAVAVAKVEVAGSIEKSVSVVTDAENFPARTECTTVGLSLKAKTELRGVIGISENISLNASAEVSSAITGTATLGDYIECSHTEHYVKVNYLELLQEPQHRDDPDIACYLSRNALLSSKRGAEQSYAMWALTRNEFVEFDQHYKNNLKSRRDDLESLLKLYATDATAKFIASPTPGDQSLDPTSSSISDSDDLNCFSTECEDSCEESDDNAVSSPGSKDKAKVQRPEGVKPQRTESTMFASPKVTNKVIDQAEVQRPEGVKPQRPESTIFEVPEIINNTFDGRVEEYRGQLTSQAVGGVRKIAKGGVSVQSKSTIRKVHADLRTRLCFVLSDPYRSDEEKKVVTEQLKRQATEIKDKHGNTIFSHWKKEEANRLDKKLDDLRRKVMTRADPYCLNKRGREIWAIAANSMLDTKGTSLKLSEELLSKVVDSKLKVTDGIFRQILKENGLTRNLRRLRNKVPEKFSSAMELMKENKLCVTDKEFHTFLDKNKLPKRLNYLRAPPPLLPEYKKLEANSSDPQVTIWKKEMEKWRKTRREMLNEITLPTAGVDDKGADGKGVSDKDAGIKKHLRYLKNDFAEYTKLQARIARKGGDTDQNRKTLENLAERYGAIKPEQLLHRMIIINANLFIQAKEASKNNLDQVQKQNNEDLQKEITDFEKNLLLPTFKVDDSYMKTHGYFLERGSLDTKGTETSTEIAVDTFGTTFKAGIKYNSYFRDHSNQLRDGKYSDLTISFSISSLNAESFINSLTPHLPMDLTDELKSQLCTKIADYMGTLALSGTVTHEVTLQWESFKANLVTEKYPDSPLRELFFRISKTDEFEVGLDGGYSGTGVGISASYNYAKKITRSEHDEFKGGSLLLLLNLGLHEYGIGNGFTMKAEHKSAFEQILRDYAKEVKDVDKGKPDGLIMEDLDSLEEDFKNNPIFKHDPNKLTEFNTANQKLREAMQDFASEKKSFDETIPFFEDFMLKYWPNFKSRKTNTSRFNKIDLPELEDAYKTQAKENRAEVTKRTWKDNASIPA